MHQVGSLFAPYPMTCIARLYDSTPRLANVLRVAIVWRIHQAGAGFLERAVLLQFSSVLQSQ